MAHITSTHTEELWNHGKSMVSKPKHKESEETLCSWLAVSPDLQLKGEKGVDSQGQIAIFTVYLSDNHTSVSRCGRPIPFPRRQFKVLSSCCIQFQVPYLWNVNFICQGYIPLPPAPSIAQKPKVTLLESQSLYVDGAG